ncbi:hypothetical protein NQ315_001813 [Exocentrus adspersus]|uniref:Uncharacterized protein n=1 Tax=Exocentrus adspersus TaxID=1586481 RepID=A0AAV8WAP1_9CUCU|nr:hypothetical protein NQ315_001813 [Exocentrus adspersus]
MQNTSSTEAEGKDIFGESENLGENEEVIRKKLSSCFEVSTKYITIAKIQRLHKYPMANYADFPIPYTTQVITVFLTASLAYGI